MEPKRQRSNQRGLTPGDNMICPFCGLDPYEYVDVGIGSVPVAVNCCEYGYALIVEGVPYDVLKKRHDKESLLAKMTHKQHYYPPVEEDEIPF